MYRIAYKHSRLTFYEPAGTSRGVYHHRDVWYIYLQHTLYGKRIGIGECAPLPGLSCDDTPHYESLLDELCQRINESGTLPSWEELLPTPSILFGLEIALRHLEVGDWALWDTPFARGEQGLQINGLVWMGDYRQMLERIEQKLNAGFRCLKMKIGAIALDDELTLLKHIRSRFSREVLELRVDANGAFAPHDAPGILEQLSRYELHSIEQPIAPGQWEALAHLVSTSPIPIALDEELIGHHSLPERSALLDSIRPHYIILKPSLHGGVRGANEWIHLASMRNIGWWATSALESNVGLNAIAQWCATHQPLLPQGLGTGQLFKNNVDVPLSLEGERLWFGR